MALKKKPHKNFLPPQELVDSIRNGDYVTIQIPNGIGRHGQEWKEATGRAVMRGPVGWALNMGGPHGTPGVASAENIVSVRKRKEPRDSRNTKPALAPAMVGDDPALPV